MTDKSTSHWAGVGLVIFLLLTLCFIGALALLSRTIPDVLPQLGRDALIGLLGLLAKSPVGTDPQPVNVVNNPTQPVPVDPQPEQLEAPQPAVKKAPAKKAAAKKP